MVTVDIQILLKMIIEIQQFGFCKKTKKIAMKYSFMLFMKEKGQSPVQLTRTEFL